MNPMRPCGNVQTGKFSASHPGYDFDDIPDNRVVACLDGVVQQSVFKYSSAWLQGQVGDPTPGLTTEDYGNYLKIRHSDGTFSLYAHLSPDGPRLEAGSIVKRGQVIARIGHTGNSTGAHLHFEFRNSENKSISVQFDQYSPIKEEDIMPETIVVEIPTWERVRNNSESYDALTDSLGLPRNASKGDSLLALNNIKKDLQEAKKSLENSSSIQTPELPPTIDPEKWEADGLITEETINGIKFIVNHKRKDI